MDEYEQEAKEFAQRVMRDCLPAEVEEVIAKLALVVALEFGSSAEEIAGRYMPERLQTAAERRYA